jgi:hypothetical protein
MHQPDSDRRRGNDFEGPDELPAHPLVVLLGIIILAAFIVYFSPSTSIEVASTPQETAITND